MNFIRLALSNADGTPSSQRCSLLVLLVFTLDLVACGFYAEGHLPDIPATLADLIKWLFGFLAAGIGLGKVTGAVAGTKSGAEQ